ncbi:MAG: hypothetical protein HC897_09285 [Thermoanaerobaculia bacterium]|nr:hypothetical protein [Thermoanaerobaculia bacterium]
MCGGAGLARGGRLVFALARQKLIENAARPDLPKLRADLERLRAKYPQLDDDRLALKIIASKANRAGLVGFLTGFGGLPLLPIMLPIDLASTIKIQSEMVHLLRLLKKPDGVDADDFIAQAGLWALSSGSLRLTSTSAAAVRELVLKEAAQSLVKFIPLLGGVIGYALGWLSTQAMGRGALRLETRKNHPVGNESKPQNETT